MNTPLHLRNIKTIKERREAVEKALNIHLTNIGTFSVDEQAASTKNCENMIGVTQVPLGIAGPLTLLTKNEDHVMKREYYLPLATTEGALVASVSRGSKAIFHSDGATVRSQRVGATRGPVFKVRNMDQSDALYDYIISHEKEFQTIAQTTSKHISLTRVETNSIGLYRYLRFYFDTKDAMGLNMVTIATDAIVRFIEKETNTTCVSLSGNFCVDKKPSWVNMAYGRGFEVWAEVVIPEAIVSDVLKTTPRAVYQTWLAKCMIGSAISGSMGFNAQYANILSALFIACGQDPAHVAECAVGITTAEIVQNGATEDLYISIYAPDLMVGTVGGGTGLGTQSEALSVLGISGGNDGNNAQSFAEIVGGALLAGEISLLSSLSEGSLVHAHKQLGRGEKII